MRRLLLVLPVLFSLILLPSVAAAEDRTLFEFDEDNLDRVWTTVNDGVMGGRSSGGPRFSEGVLTFAGTINTNGGGFSSIRTRERDWGFEAGGGIVIRVQGDGRQYDFDLRTGERLGRRTIAYRTEFVAPEGDGWFDIRLPFGAFVPTVWGNDVSGRVAALDPTKVRAIGFNLGDGIDGPFELRVDRISAYAAPPEMPELPAPELPESWMGLWSGVSTATYRDGRTLDFPTSLEIHPVEGQQGRWTWTLIYGEGEAAQVRAYELVGVLGSTNRFQVDEKNGIVLEQFFAGDALYGRFVVGNSDIVGSYRLLEGGEAMEMELVTYAAPSDAAETGGENGVPSVLTAVPVAIQRGQLLLEGATDE